MKSTKPPWQLVMYWFFLYSFNARDKGWIEPNQFINVEMEGPPRCLRISVVGYGTQKGERGGSIATVRPNELKVGGVSSVTNNCWTYRRLIGVQSAVSPDRMSPVLIRDQHVWGGAVPWCWLTGSINCIGIEWLSTGRYRKFSVLKMPPLPPSTVPAVQMGLFYQHPAGKRVR